MKKDTVVELRRPGQGQDLLSTMLRDGAQRLVAQAVEAEFADFLARAAGERLADGRAAVVRNGFQPEREILTGLGSVRVRVPKARSRGEEAAVFRSSLVPPYVRRARSATAWTFSSAVMSTANPTVPISLDTRSTPSGLTSVTTTLAPSSVNRRAQASPMPPPLPVITTTLSRSNTSERPLR